MSPARKARAGGAGFTLIELLAVVALIGILAGLLFPAVGRGLASGRAAFCTANLRQMHVAYMLYLADHDGRFFPLRENTKDCILWYWGLEKGGGGEGERELDKSQARLAPYLGRYGGADICPALPYRAAYFKRKFDLASYGYGLNTYLIADSPECRRSGLTRFTQIEQPGGTIIWGDAIQINTWQAPASPANPMLEEWYALDARSPPKFHFRHRGRFQAVFGDGSVRAFMPHALDPRCDGLVGRLEPPGEDQLLRPRK